MEVYLKEYAIKYKTLTKKLYENDKDTYDKDIFCARVLELKKCMILKRINKPSSQGTIITFKAAETTEEIEKEIIDLKKLAVELFSDDYISNIVS